MSRTPTKKEKSLNKNHKASHILARQTLLRLPNEVLNAEENTLFESRKNQNHVKKASFMSEQDVGRLSNKVMTSDESTSRKGSKLQQSIFISEHRLPNQEYFHQPLAFKQKRKREAAGIKGNQAVRKSKLENISTKLDQMHEMVRSHQKEYKELKNSMNSRQLQRLLKMQSVEKLKMVESMTLLHSSINRRNKRL